MPPHCHHFLRRRIKFTKPARGRISSSSAVVFFVRNTPAGELEVLTAKDANLSYFRVVEELVSSGALVAVPAYWAARKVLGPTFEEIGIELRDRYSDRRKRNAQNILNAMNKRLSQGGETYGQIPPRISIKVLEEGSWCDDAVMSEYFGGLLAASSSNDESDDRGTTWASLVSRLATRDIQLHYLSYLALRKHFVGFEELQLGLAQDRLSAQIYLPVSGLLDAMNLERSSQVFNRNCGESLISLRREDLVGERYVVGSTELIQSQYQVSVPEDGLVFTPTVSGLQLFYWAHGLGRADINAILQPDLNFDFDTEVLAVEGSLSIRDLADTQNS